jgi:hypothetical protein
MSALRSWVVLLAAAFAGCGAHPLLDVGSRDGGAIPTDADPDAGADGGGGPVWIGSLVDAQLPNGSNGLRMMLDVASDDTVKGTLLLGSGSVLRPPTDADGGYPPGVEFPVIGGPGFVEGFRYTMIDGNLTGSHLTFRLAEFETWTQWCPLQTQTYPSAIGGYSCAPSGSFSMGPDGCSATDPQTMAVVPFDCGKWELCIGMSSPCQCSATGCQVNPSTQPDTSFDLVLAGDSADGTISGGLGDHRVHFTRTP